MSTEETITFNLELNVEQAFSKTRQIETLLFRVLRLFGRISKILGIPEDSPASVIIERIQKIVMMVRLLHTSVILLETASGPIGWVKLGVGAATAGVATIDIAQQWGSTQ